MNEALQRALKVLTLQIEAYEKVLQEGKKDIKSPDALKQFLAEKEMLKQLKKHQKKLQNELRK